MEESRSKEVLDFVLSSYRAKMAIQNPNKNCPFDFSSFLSTWKSKCGGDFQALKRSISADIEPLIAQGIFDSITPYLSASINSNQSTGVEDNSVISAEMTPSTKLPKPKHEALENDPEIVIHVCDEGKSLRQDFTCVQSLLVAEMGYFSKVTVKGQKLQDMDISVHCDLSVFQWLMSWVKKVELPKLEPSNVIGLMVSAEFLQMPTLTSECVRFTAENIGDVICSSPNLGCLNESLTAQLAAYFNNIELENKIAKLDKSDRITSRLYTQFTLALNERDGGQSQNRGHFASTATMFRCSSCSKLLTNEVASKVPCNSNSNRLDAWGRIYAIHYKDTTWVLSNYIRELKRELKSWRRVYWRLWASVHFLQCENCELVFPMKDFSSCRAHPKAPNLCVVVNPVTGEVLRDRTFDPEPKKEEECINPFRKSREPVKEEVLESRNVGYGVYPCCGASAYKFWPLPPQNGCQFRNHKIRVKADDPLLLRLELFRDLIVLPPPKDKKLQLKSSDWGGISDLSPLKCSIPSTSMISPWSLGTFRPAAITLRAQSSSTESQSQSESEDNAGDVPVLTSARGQSNGSDFWSWNPDFTTRYNQDMQREKEEKLMTDLELLLSQKVNFGNESGSSLRFGYVSRRTSKNVGGSFVKLEEKWREEQGKGKFHGRQNAKSAKP